MQVDTAVAWDAAEEVLEGPAVSHKLMRLHQRQIDNGVGVKDGFWQKQPLYWRIGPEFNFDHLVLAEVNHCSTCRFHSLFHAGLVEGCPAGVVNAVGFAHDDFAVAVAEQAYKFPH